jgi:type 2A phosphatase activator TIP41
MANEAWLNHTTEQLLELCQYSPQQRRRINLPEVCFSHATVKVTLGSLSLTWNCYEALQAWSQPMLRFNSDRRWNFKAYQSSKQLMQNYGHGRKSKILIFTTIGRTRHHCRLLRLVQCFGSELPQSGLNLALLQDTSQPILYFDDIELYEDDLHDNGVVNVRVKLRLMPTCLYVLSRCWCRVDGTPLRCRETRTMVEFGDTPQSHRVYRDITWRQCQWTDLIKYNLPTDARAWKNEGTTETPAWNALLNRLPIIPLPDGNIQA